MSAFYNRIVHLWEQHIKYILSFVLYLFIPLDFEKNGRTIEMNKKKSTQIKEIEKQNLKPEILLSWILLRNSAHNRLKACWPVFYLKR